MRPLDGYPTSIGSSKLSVFPHAGPSSYTQVTIGAANAAISGGDPVRASEAGMKLFDTVLPATTDEGAFRLVPVPNAPSTSINGASAPTCTLMWVANKTATFGGQAQTINTEAVAATDLSAFTARLTAIGAK